MKTKVVKGAPTKIVLSQTEIEAAERLYSLNMIDNSPILDMIAFRDTMETVSALNLGELIHEMVAISGEMPLLIEHSKDNEMTTGREGYLMAVAFEAGRRYNLLQALQMLTDEVDVLPKNRIDSRQMPLLEM